MVNIVFGWNFTSELLLTPLALLQLKDELRALYPWKHGTSPSLCEDAGCSNLQIDADQTPQEGDASVVTVIFSVTGVQ